MNGFARAKVRGTTAGSWTGAHAAPSTKPHVVYVVLRSKSAPVQAAACRLNRRRYHCALAALPLVLSCPATLRLPQAAVAW